MGINGVELAGLDQRGDHGPVLGADVVTGEESVLAIQRDGADGPLDGVVVELDPAVAKEQAEAVPVFGDGFQRRAQRRFRPDASPVAGEPGVQVSDDRCGALLPGCETGRGITPADLRLDAIEFADTPAPAIGAGPVRVISTSLRRAWAQQ